MLDLTQSALRTKQMWHKTDEVTQVVGVYNWWWGCPKMALCLSLTLYPTPNNGTKQDVCASALLGVMSAN